MTKPSPQDALAEREGRIWAGFLRAHDLVTSRIDTDLRMAGDLALSEFEVLLHLAAAGGEKRMAHLAHDLVLTGGGITRIVLRMEKLRYLGRRPCDVDGRGIFAALTERGWMKYREARKTVVESVRRAFFKETSAEEMRVLESFFDRVVTRARSSAADDACTHAAEASALRVAARGRKRS